MEPSTDSRQVDTPPDKPKKSRLWRYLSWPFWAVMFCCWFGYETFLPQNWSLLVTLILIAGVFHLINTGFARWFQGPPKPRTWRMAKYMFVQILVIWTGALSILCLMWHWVPPVAISEKTTHITTPLTADGMEIDAMQAIADRFAPKGPMEDNGFRRVILCFGPGQVCGKDDAAPGKHEERVTQLCRHLNINPNEPLEASFQPPVTFFHERIETQDLSEEEKTFVALQRKAAAIVRQMTEKPWHNHDSDHGIAGGDIWLQQNSVALDKFGEAVRMPYYHEPSLVRSPFMGAREQYDTATVFHRNIVQALQCRIMYSLAKSDLDQAFYDTESILMLTDALTRHLNSTGAFWSVRVLQRVGNDSVRKILEYGHPSREQIEKLRALFHAYRTEVNRADIVFMSRLEMTHDLLLAASSRMFESDIWQQNSHSLFETRFSQFTFAGFRYFAWNPVFAAQQTRFDQLAVLVKESPSKTQYAIIIRMEDEKSSMGILGGDNSLPSFLKFYLKKGFYHAFPTFIGQAFGSNSISTDALLGQSWYHGHVQRQLTDIALALELYRLDHGTYPKELAALQGTYLDEIPNDPFTDGELFQYESSDAGYQLYSIGPNGKDDGGFNKYERCKEGTDQTRDGDDIRIMRSPKTVTTPLIEK